MNRRQVPLIGLITLLAMLAVACAGAAQAPPLPESANSAGRPTAAPVAAPLEAPYGDADDQVNQAPAVPDQPLIIYTGSLDLEVTDINAAVAQADQAIRGLGGHVAASQATDTEDGKSATVTYRIPAERWSEALTALKALATRVVTENTESQDVTAEVVDLDARLANLRTTEAALQSIMDRATTISDVLKVQAELTKVRSDIERLTAQRENLANRAALATLQVGFNVPIAKIERVSAEWDLGSEVESALAALVRLGQWALSLLIWTVIVLIPLFVPIIVVVYLAFLLRRRWLRNHPPAQPVTGPPSGPWPPSM